MSVLLSIIIPTYNRKNSLSKCLYALVNQVTKMSYEVLIIDDGSTDNTDEMIKKWKKNDYFKLRHFRQENKGPASARNIGIKQARGDILLFIGDDIIATPSLIEQHMAFHCKYPEENVAMLGYVTWSSEVKVTPFMYWLEHGGPQFQYYKFRHQEKVKAFWTCNISLKREFMIKEGIFDEDFIYAAYEDTELGYRLQKKGLQIIYNKNATAYHYHSTNIEKYCYRQKLVGKSFIILHKKYPEIFKMPLEDNILKKNVWTIFKLVVPYLKKIAIILDCKNIRLPNILYKIIMHYYYQRGIQEK